MVETLFASRLAKLVNASALSHHHSTGSRLVTTGISFQGLYMDVGHLRHLRWVKNDDPKAPIDQDPVLVANGKSAAFSKFG